MDVTTGEARFAGAAGVELFRRWWRPAGVHPRAVVVLAHGMGEHSGRYDEVARYLASRGVAVHALDHRGHGRSGGETGTVECFAYFLDDLSGFLQLARSEEPAGIPMVLLGHSMGGLIAAACVLERKPRPDLLVLSGPAIVPILDPNDRRIDPTRLSRDEAAQQAYLDDPYVLRERVQETLFPHLFEGIGLLVGRAGEVTMPLLLLHGADDRVCSAEGAEAWVRAAGASDVTVHLYPEGRHEMFQETNRAEVFADLWAWLDARIPRGA